MKKLNELQKITLVNKLTQAIDDATTEALYDIMPGVIGRLRIDINACKNADDLENCCTQLYSLPEPAFRCLYSYYLATKRLLAQ